ncbi:MAG: PQQ-dependent sugar dehydrogenase [Chloroflexota bacterium]
MRANGWLLVALAVVGLLLAVYVLGAGARSLPPAAPEATPAATAMAQTTPSRAGPAAAPPPPGAAAVDVRVVADGLDTPWAIAFAPDGRLFFTERTGEVRVIVDGALRAQPVIRLDASEIGEGGAMGLAVDPGFPAQPYLYAAYTYDAAEGIKNRLVRLRLAGNAATVDEVLLDDIPGGRIHNGGRLAVGPDGKLYLTTGDAGQAALAQDPQSLAGKILRLNLDGSIPDDNPFSGSLVYTLGHRNPQGLAWQPGTGRLYATEHGPSGNDEVNLIEPGNNYGWPEAQGEQHGTFTAPLLVFNPAVAPAGAAFLAGESVPQWRDSLFFATLRGTQLHRLQLDPADPRRIVRAERLYEGEYGRLRDVVQGPDGALYLTTSNRDGRGSPEQRDDRILRLGAAAERPLLYPNLKTVPPRDLTLDTEVIDGERHYVLRFTNVIWNAGEGPLELREVAVDESSRVYQNTYDEAGAYLARLAGEFVYHPEHDHWHFDQLASFELWTQESFQRWLDSGRREGAPGWTMSKTSVCMMDNRQRQALPGSPRGWVYTDKCERQTQGISVGWEDIYEWDLDDQWVDLGGHSLADGTYVLRSVVDFAGTIHESPGGADPTREGEEDNEAVVTFTVEDGEIESVE